MNDNQLVFTSDNIDKSRARSRQDYFVNIIKNPILRFLLRVHVIKGEDIAKKLQKNQPAPAPVVRPPIETKPKPRPQCRMNIRIAGRVIEKKKKNKSTKIAIIVLSILLALSIGAAVYFAIS